MKKKYIYLIVALACMAAIIFFAGYRMAKSKYDKPLETKIESDTIIMYDTIPHYYPKPVGVERVRTEYQWLPLAKIVHDTVGFSSIVKDSALVEVPITSKHYHGEEYDAYVSGYLPNLDSISIYQKTEVVTTTITQMKPPNKWEVNVVGGMNYNTASSNAAPYALGELLYKPSRVQFGVQGGVMRQGNKTEPFFGGNVKIQLF